MRGRTAFALFLVIVLTAGTVVAQSNGVVVIAANSKPATNTAPPSGPIALTPQEMQARIEAQQQQINNLSALIEQLQARLEPIASAKPMLPPAVPAAALPTPPAPADPKPAVNSPAVPRELLPDIGHIGAQLGLLVGESTNPFKETSGFSAGGFIDLPLKKVPGGKLSYEIMVNLQRSVTRTASTSGVNVLVDAVTNAYLGNTAANGTSLTNYLAGPLPVTSVVQERGKILTVAPFELKYTLTKWGRFRPYGVAGLGAYVYIGSDNNSATFNANTALGPLASAPVGNSTLGNTLNALLQGSQIGGLAPTSPELAARGVPHGQGNLLFGGQFGGGAEYRITPKYSIGFDYRFNLLEAKNSNFSNFSFKQGFHW